MHIVPKKPCLNASFLIVFPAETDTAPIQLRLPEDSCVEHYPEEVCVTVAEVKDCFDWNIDSVLTELFDQCDLDHLKRIADEFKGQIHIALWYYSYDARPALIFEGKNMQIIHQLNADLSIDAY